MTKRLVICETCAGPSGPLADAVRAALPDWDIVLHPCLSVCDDPVALAAQGAGKATYVFAGLTEADVADVARFATAYDAAPDGWIADARPLGRLRFCLKSRVPAL